MTRLLPQCGSSAIHAAFFKNFILFFALVPHSSIQKKDKMNYQSHVYMNENKRSV